MVLHVFWKLLQECVSMITVRGAEYVERELLQRWILTAAVRGPEPVRENHKKCSC
jgi:hypothetical protein